MPSQAQSDQTQVRFLHAVAGAGAASLLVESGRPRLPSSFAKPSGYQVFRPGQARLRLILNGQSSPLVSETVRLGPGKHTVVAVGDGKNVDLLVYRDDGVEPGKATLRAIHVAAEVGKADVSLDGKTVVTGVGLGDATDYLPVPPGRHSVAVTRPGGEGGALVKAQVRSVAGTASTAFVVGSAGMPAQVVLTEDGTAGPTAAPATGLGGATSDGGWLLILGSSLIGGALGGTSYVLARRTRTRGALQVATPKPATAPPETPAPSSLAAEPPAEAALASVVAEAPAAPAPASVVAETPATPAASSVAAGPPVKADRKKARKADEPKAEPPARTGAAPDATAAAAARAHSGDVGHDPGRRGAGCQRKARDRARRAGGGPRDSRAGALDAAAGRALGRAGRPRRPLHARSADNGPLTGGSRFVRPDAPAADGLRAAVLPALHPPRPRGHARGHSGRRGRRRGDRDRAADAADLQVASGGHTQARRAAAALALARGPSPEPYPPAPAAMPDPLARRSRLVDGLLDRRAAGSARAARAVRAGAGAAGERSRAPGGGRGPNRRVVVDVSRSWSTPRPSQTTPPRSCPTPGWSRPTPTPSWSSSKPTWSKPTWSKPKWSKPKWSRPKPKWSNPAPSSSRRCHRPRSPLPRLRHRPRSPLPKHR